MKRVELYKHMGITLINLLELLYMCDDGVDSTERFFELAVESTCTIMKSVTIKVFCAWAEVNINVYKINL